MIRDTVRTLLPTLCLLSVACAGTDKESGKTPSPAGEEKWEMLVEDSWTLAAGGEDPDWCKKLTLTEDIYVSAIRPVHPAGTHHTLVGVSDTAEGERCTTSVVTGLLYAAGVGSEGVHLPKGVAMKLPAGKVVNLGLHLYNTSDQQLSGTSGMEIVRMDPADVEYESETVLAGPFSISIPNGRQTLTHECPITDEQTVYALFPHMHQLGVHFKTIVTVGGVERVLHDGPYDFEEQYQLPVDNLKLMPGDTVKTECTFENDTNRTVTFGESSDTEMCFSVLFRYPRTGASFCGGAGGVRPTLAGPACVAVGAAGNENGVGKHCTAGGDECGTDGLCLADVTRGEFGNFCTNAGCTDDASCGTGATCTGMGTKVCIPNGCSFSIGGDAGAPAVDGG